MIAKKWLITVAVTVRNLRLGGTCWNSIGPNTYHDDSDFGMLGKCESSPIPVSIKQIMRPT